MQNTEIPEFVTPFLWSYDIERLDIRSHKHLIIHNVLNFGSKKATDWLFSVYSKKDIQEVLSTIPKSAWSKKSLTLWSLIFGVSPKHATRFV